MRTYDNIYLPVFEIFDGFFLLCRCTETAEQVHTYRKLFHSLNKSIINLLCKNRCRNEIDYLTALLHRFKCGTKCNLCLAVADIPTHKTIHDLCAFHVPLRIFDGGELILCLLIRKHFFKLPLPDSVRATDITFFFLTYRIKFDQLTGNVSDCTFDL